MPTLDPNFCLTIDRSDGRPALPPERYRAEIERDRKATDFALRVPEGRARDKFRAFTERVEERHAVSRHRQTKIERARDLRDRQAANVAQLEKMPPLEGDGRLLVEREELRRLNAELAALVATGQERWRLEFQDIALLEALRDYAADHGAALTPCAAAQATARDLDALRANVLELAEKVRDVSFAAYPSAWAKQRAREQIEALADRGRPDVMPLIDSGQKIVFASKTLPELAENLPDTQALLFWLNRDALLEAIGREIDENSDDATALAPEDRKPRRMALLAQLLEAERAEEAAVVAAEAEGMEIFRRADLDPRGFFECDGAAPRDAR